MENLEKFNLEKLNPSEMKLVQGGRVRDLLAGRPINKLSGLVIEDVRDALSDLLED